MTDRKPAELTFESWVDRQIRVATERGEMDGLAGAGQPLPAGPRDDEADGMGWIRRKLAEEGLPTDALLPLSLQLRRAREALPGELDRIDPRLPDAESEARRLVSDLNRRIAAWMRAPSPPMLPLAPVDADPALAGWRERAARRNRHEADGRTGATAAGDAADGGTAAGGRTAEARATEDMPAGHSDTDARPRGRGSAPGDVTVYWRPGCPFCQRLRLHLRLRRLRPRMVNIWRDPDAAAFVRSVADGNETVPTVVIDGEAHVNPAPRTVVAALRRR